MIKKIAFVALILLPGCISMDLTHINLKTNVGNTQYDTGTNALYTGGSAEFQFDVKKH